MSFLDDDKFFVSRISGISYSLCDTKLWYKGTNSHVKSFMCCMKGRVETQVAHVNMMDVNRLWVFLCLKILYVYDVI